VGGVELPPHKTNGSKAGAPFAALERAVGLATLAPSGGNSQPWRFTYGSSTLHCWRDEDRSRSFLDFDHRATHLAFGALSENLRLAAGALGLGLKSQAFPDTSQPALVMNVAFGGRPEPLSSEDARLQAQIELRVTNRRNEQRVVLRTDHRRSLEDIAARAGARLRLLAEPKGLDALGEILARGDRLRFLSRPMHRDMTNEIRWSRENALATRDGLELATLELSAADQAALRLVSDWSVMVALAETGGGEGLGRSARRSVAAASAMGLLTMPPAGRDISAKDSYFRGGVALQRVWLLATELGLAFQPMTALVYLFARLEDGQAEGFEGHERRELGTLRSRYRELWRLVEPEVEIILFRLAYAGPPSARSLRRPVSEVLSFQG
jgi:nitroreductase